MAKPRFYILRDGEKLYRDTIQAIATLAQREANRTREDVWVHSEEMDVFGRPTGRKPTRAVRKSPEFKRNPVRKKGSGQKAHYVKYTSAGRVQVEKCGNKGMATIKANELKRSGYTNVRVSSAP